MAGDKLAGELANLLRRTDPVPELVRHAAAASLAWRDPDAELAALVQDTAADDTTRAAVRGPVSRLLTFAAGNTMIDLEVTSEPDGVRLTGQLSPMRAALITISQPDQKATSPAVRADPLGRFEIAGLHPGLVRVRCAPTDDGAGGGTGAITTTEWFAV